MQTNKNTKPLHKSLLANNVSNVRPKPYDHIHANCYKSLVRAVELVLASMISLFRKLIIEFRLFYWILNSTSFPTVSRLQVKPQDLAINIISPKLKKSIYSPLKDNFPYKFCSYHLLEILQVIYLENSILQLVENSKKMRTFLLHGQYLKGLEQTLEKMFHSLPYIRVLDLSFSNVVELPNSIEVLKLLRYLDLSRTQIKSLPNSICNLYNLQTLKLLGCRMLPSKMGNSTTLKKLNAFVVSDTSGHGIAKPQDIAYLAALHTLKLGNAVNEANTKVEEKESLQRQVLDWSGRDFNEQDEVKAERGLKDLKGHSNLEDLAIHHFVGTKSPSWMTDGLLQNLVTLSLYHCTKCKILSLGQLPCLKVLYIKGMQKLEEWPEDQYTSLCTLHIINCPKLRKVPNFMSHLRFLKGKKCDSLKAPPTAPSLLFLIIINNLVLEDWQEGRCIAQYDQGNLVDQSSPVFVGPLQLKLVNCSKIHLLPQQCAPQKLEISGLRALPNTNSLDSLVISNITDLICSQNCPIFWVLRLCTSMIALTSLSQAKESSQSLSSLRLLSIQGCPMLESLPDEGLPTALECLMIGLMPPSKVSRCQRASFYSRTCIWGVIFMHGVTFALT
ncbi:putative disease resistance protein RGA3 [Durio zibethinus]|uniref:Disease resistance protein RGA3 n=1 Tax=Durio zibethinus TaxID=66656 RepID=A0A6P5WUY3_DURZI|nr:putative disease resistance protein RGA3 [Durio zibethinus]